MKSFKDFIIETKEPFTGFCNAGGHKKQYNDWDKLDKSKQSFSNESFIGFCNAGGPSNQPINEATARTKTVKASGEILTDPASDTAGLSDSANHYSRFVTQPSDTGHYVYSRVQPHLTGEQARHYAALANNTQRSHRDYTSIVPNYTNSSFKLNQHLYDQYRKNRDHDPVVQGINISNLDRLIDMHKTPHAMSVYTGAHFNPTDHAGQHIILPAYTSTSLSPHVAKDFGKHVTQMSARSDPKSIRHILRIHLPEGHPHLFMDHHSCYQGQSELLLPRQTRIQLAERPSHIVKGNFNEHFSDSPEVYNHVIHFWDAKIVP